MNAIEFRGPILVTAGYFLVYYVFLLNILRTKMRVFKAYKSRGEKFDRYFSQDREMLAADRIQLNMLEHMPLFLLLMWLHAAFISIPQATWLGGIYTGSRLIYPIIVGGRLGREIPIKITPITFTGYIINFYFVGALVWSALQ